jgi:hypothetical protein
MTDMEGATPLIARRPEAALRSTGFVCFGILILFLLSMLIICAFYWIWTPQGGQKSNCPSGQ